MRRFRNFLNNRKRSKSTSSAASSEPAKDIKDENDSYEGDRKDYEVKVPDKWNDDNNLNGPVVQAVPMKDEEEKATAPRKWSVLDFFSRKKKDNDTAENVYAPKGDVFANYLDDSSRPIDYSDINELENQPAVIRSVDDHYDDGERLEPMKPAVESEDKDEPNSPERSFAHLGAYNGDVESGKPRDESKDDAGSISSDKSPKVDIDSAGKYANDNVRDADADNERENDNSFVTTDDEGKNKDSGKDSDLGSGPNADAKEESDIPKDADNDLEVQEALLNSYSKEPKQEDDSNKILNADTTEDENRNLESKYEADSSLNTESKHKDEVEKEEVTPHQDALATSSIDEEPKANSKNAIDDSLLETEKVDQPETFHVTSDERSEKMIDDVKDISNDLTSDDDSNEPRYTAVTKSFETDEELSAVNRENGIYDNIFTKESGASGERNMSEDEGEVTPQVTDVVAPQVTEINQDEEEQPEVYVNPQRDIGDLVHDLTKAIDAADDVQDSPDDIFQEVKRITDNYIKKNQIDTVEQNQLIYPTALQMLGRRRRFTKGIAGGATLESCLSRASQTFPEAKYFAVVNELYNINAPDLWSLSKGKDKLNDPILNFVDGDKLQESFCENLYEHMRKEKKIKIKNLVLGELVSGRLFSRDSSHDNAKEFIPRTGRDEFGLKLFQVDPKTLLNDTISSEFHFEGWQDVSVENESDVVSTDGNIYNPLFVKPAKGLLLKNVDKCRIQAVANTLDSNYLTTGPEGTVLIWRDWTGKHYFDLNQKVEDEEIIDAILRVRSKSTVSANRNKSFYKIDQIDESI